MPLRASRRRFSSIPLLIALIAPSSGLLAQTATPTVEGVLKRLQTNLNRYDMRVPSLFCDEQVVSSQVQPGERDQKTVTDSMFRLKRTSASDHTSTLVESREIKLIDGKPAATQKMDGPSTLSGVFEGGLAVVSLDQEACMNYSLQRLNRKHPTEPYVIRFTTALTPQNSAGCLLQEKSKGSVSIDPASMQITHLELTTPHHVIRRGGWYRSAVAGKRTLTVDYAPVVLDGETFWMPSGISQQVIVGDGTFHRTVWAFRATYRNYHRLEVTSRIVTPSETSVH